ncbi:MULTISPECIES: FAD-dependent monooxygenase [Pandoraea]|uniref:FAD-dependent monooxygenase n=1 Tax=Pandoraea TaxID=93217 RepID=UPI001F5DF677|nr:MULTISPECIES: FAD-dependent monooxygenase [Pandoraea]MCI3207478.1 monooxygenase [Pandoraea sp. LA3]MDN4585507.1 monooxygenase [Pandoraea capi]
MHKPETTPRASLYHAYRVYPHFYPRAATQSDAPTVPVTIVGGGPIGMVTALALARHGVRCVVLQAEQQVSEGSRAIVFTRRSQEILQAVGVADAVVANGLPWTSGNSYYRGQRVFRMESPVDEDDRFAPLINLQQNVLESYLVDAIEREPLVEIRWGNKLVGLTPVAQDDGSEGGVVLQIDTPEGEYTQHTAWLVAADGARSTVRTALGLRFEGASYEGRFVIADIRIDLDLPTERLAYFAPDWNPGNTVLMHREPGGIWRVDYQLPVDETSEHALQPETIRERINAQLDMMGLGGKPWDLDWCSVYSARALTLPDYVHGHILFAGDAAHLLPIFGVRGANTGFQDAIDLSWKLAAVVKGAAPEPLLASYTHDRVGAAREIIAEAGKSTRFMTPPSHGFRVLRDAVLDLSLDHEFVRPLFHWRTSRAHDYRDSPLNSPSDDNATMAAGPTVGAPAPNVKLGDNDYLYDHLGAAFHLVTFGDPPLDDTLRQEVVTWRERGVPVQVVAFALSQHSVAGADLTLPDPTGHAAAKYGAEDGTTYLVRPDHHICARWLKLDATRLADALAHATARV